MMEAKQGTTMSTVEINADQFNGYCLAMTKVEEWLKIAKLARADIERQLGDSEIATVDGEPVIRWSHTSATRLDLNKLRENVDPVLLSGCYIQDNRRRFTLIKR
jgi:hypothetical protein